MKQRKKIPGSRLFVIDTNVLMHDPSAIFQFNEHDVYLPMAVIEELDAAKKGLSEVTRNVRQVSRFIDDLLAHVDQSHIEKGIPLPSMPSTRTNPIPSGKLFLQIEELPNYLPATLPMGKADNTILATAYALQKNMPDTTVTVVSKDINLRIKAAILGIHAEDYFNDRVLDNMTLLYTGNNELMPEFWEQHGKEMASWQQDGKTYYRITGPMVQQWHPNHFLYIKSEDKPFEMRVRNIEQDTAVVAWTKDYRSTKHAVWGITARNLEQNFALNLLMDPDIDFVSLQGTAGTGKTLLTLAAGLAQTLDQNRYKEIIMTRVTVPVGEDIGFLPGTEEEKMTPWMGALLDNLEVLNHTETGGDWGRAATQDLLRHRIKIRSLNFMRGRTFLNKFIIIDEAQNLSAKQMQTLITRAGPGTKVVCLGDLSQIDTPYLTEVSSGLTYVVDRFKDWAYSGHITLTRGERSRLADFASEIF